jgi:hypothetical protein
MSKIWSLKDKLQILREYESSGLTYFGFAKFCGDRLNVEYGRNLKTESWERMIRNLVDARQKRRQAIKERDGVRMPIREEMMKDKVEQLDRALTDLDASKERSNMAARILENSSALYLQADKLAAAILRGKTLDQFVLEILETIPTKEQ